MRGKKYEEPDDEAEGLDANGVTLGSLRLERGERQDALADPDHEQYVDLRRWAGEDYDPARFDRHAATHALRLAAAWGALD